MANKKGLRVRVVKTNKRPQKKPRTPSVVVKVQEPRQLMNKAIRRSKGLKAAVKRSSMAPSYMKQAIDAITNPCMVHGMRWNEPGDCNATGSISLHHIFQVNQSAGVSTVNPALPSGTFALYTFRDVLRAGVYWYANPLSVQYIYIATFYDVINKTQSTTLTVPTNPIEPVPLTFVWMIPYTLFQPHGDHIFAGTSSVNDSLDFVWLDKDVTMYFTQVVLDATAVVQVSLWSPGKISQVYTADTFATFPPLSTSGRSGFVAPAGGYYTFAYQSSSTSPPNAVMTMYLSGNGNVFAHVPIPDAIAHPRSCSKMRMIGQSALLTNDSALLSNEGTAYAAQIPFDLAWYHAITPAVITPLTDSYTDSAKYGLYSFNKPSGKSSFDFRSVFEVDEGGVISGTNYYLDQEGYYNAHLIVTANIQNAWPGLDFFYSACYCLEFQTSDQWVEYEHPMLTAIDCMKVLEIISREPCFYDNPDHAKQLLQYMRRGLSYLRGNATKIGSVLSTIFPSHAAWIAPLSHIMQRP
jgi:hypothetical protein